MGQARLSSLAILHIESGILQSIDVDSVIDRFAEIKSRRKLPNTAR